MEQQEQQVRLQAEIAEMDHLFQITRGRCVELRSANAALELRNKTLTEQNEKQAEEIAALKTKKTKLKK
jgi:hypothetical protein